MLNVILRTWTVVALLLVGTCAGQAQSKQDLAVDLVAKKVVKSADGKETFEAGERARPGDLLEYTATYTNKGERGVRNVMANVPIPTGTEYVPGSAKPAGALATTDGREFQPIPLKRKVKAASGKMVEEDTPPALYRSLRWKLGDLAAGESKLVTLRVQVNSAVVLPAK